MDQEVKISVIGGGTGPLCTLDLSKYGYSITIISPVSDNGTSTGQILGRNPNLIPPGDMRKVVSESSRNPLFGEEIEERILYDCPVTSSRLSDLLEYYPNRTYVERLIRFLEEKGFQEALEQDTGLINLEGHPLGNLLLSSLMLTYGNSQGVQKLCELADTSVEVLPASEQRADFCYMTEGSERPMIGEKYLDEQKNDAEPIIHCWLDPEVGPYETSLNKIRESDVVVLSPTSLYASLISILLIPGYKEALEDKPIIWVGNIMTEWNQTGYSTHSLSGLGHVEILKEYLDRYPDHVIAPRLKGQTIGEVFGPYEEEGASIVLYREKEFGDRGIGYQEVNMIEVIDIVEKGDPKRVLRHNRETLAEVLDQVIKDCI